MWPGAEKKMGADMGLSDLLNLPCLLRVINFIIISMIINVVIIIIGIVSFFTISIIVNASRCPPRPVCLWLALRHCVWVCLEVMCLFE